MKKLITLLMLCAAAHAHELTERELQDVKIVQRPGSQIPLDLPFTDAEGKAVTLKDSFRGPPVLLIPIDYTCKMLCEALSNGVAGALRESPLKPGKDYRVTFFSIDPKASPKDTQATAGRLPGGDYLTGTQSSIEALARSIGFQTRRDPKTGEIAHPAGFVVVQPDGKIFRYFSGVTFSANELTAAIESAAKGEPPPSPIDQLVYLCFHYNPARSAYGPLVMKLTRGLALATLVLIVAVVIRSRRSK